jgi:hypothetical protein
LRLLLLLLQLLLLMLEFIILLLQDWKFRMLVNSVLFSVLRRVSCVAAAASPLGRVHALGGVLLVLPGHVGEVRKRSQLPSFVSK